MYKNLTKFCVLQPTKSKTAVETEKNLIEMFRLLGAPFSLQSDNGREFSNQAINNLMCWWSYLQLVHVKPRLLQSQGSLERCNRDVRDAIICSIANENTGHWVDGLCFVH